MVLPRFFLADFSVWYDVLNPIQKPCIIPDMKRVTKSLLGWCCSITCHAAGFNGVDTLAVFASTMTTSGDAVY